MKEIFCSRNKSGFFLWQAFFEFQLFWQKKLHSKLEGQRSCTFSPEYLPNNPASFSCFFSLWPGWEIAMLNKKESGLINSILHVLCVDFCKETVGKVKRNQRSWRHLHVQFVSRVGKAFPWTHTHTHTHTHRILTLNECCRIFSLNRQQNMAFSCCQKGAQLNDWNRSKMFGMRWRQQRM